MRWSDFSPLDELGLSSFEKKALVTLGSLGVADAAELCRVGGIPSSKIYLATEKLAELGLIELQRSRPKLYSALAPDLVAARLVELAQRRAEQLAQGQAALGRAFADLVGRVRGKRANVDIALGPEAHVKRHLVRLAMAREQVLSYVEAGDLAAIDAAVSGGFQVLRRIARNAEQRGLTHRAVFGFSHQTAPRLLAFLSRHGRELAHLSGVRYSGELGHPFHIVDREAVILALDHAFVPGGRVASILITDAELAGNLATGFEGLWGKAMQSLREIRFHPGRSTDG